MDRDRAAAAARRRRGSCSPRGASPATRTVIAHCQTHHRSGLAYLVGTRCSAIRTSAAITVRGPTGVIATIHRSRQALERASFSCSALLPQHAPVAIARTIRELAALLAQPLIHAFSAAYGVSLQEAERRSDRRIPHVQRFLYAIARAGCAAAAQTDPDALVSPADGTVSQLGTIRDGQLLQAKGLRYPLNALLLDRRRRSDLRRRLVRDHLSRAVGLPPRTRTDGRSAGAIHRRARRTVFRERDAPKRVSSACSAATSVSSCISKPPLGRWRW